MSVDSPLAKASGGSEHVSSMSAIPSLNEANTFKSMAMSVGRWARGFFQRKLCCDAQNDLHCHITCKNLPPKSHTYYSPTDFD